MLKQLLLKLFALAFAWACVGAHADSMPIVWSLEEAVRHALTNSPTARIASHRVAGAQALLKQSEAAFWPALRLNSSYLRTDHPVSVFGHALNQRAYGSNLDFNDVPDADNWNVQGILAVPLYTGGQVRGERKSAQRHEVAAREEARAVRAALAFEVTRTFHHVAKAKVLVEAGESSVQAFEANLTNALRRLEAGTALRTDVLDVEVRLAQAREDLVKARNGLALTRRSLANLLGLNARDLEITAPTTEYAPLTMSTPPERAELAAARARVEAATAQVRVAKAGYVPKLSALGGLDFNKGWELKGSGTSYSAGLLMQWEAWNGQATRARVRESEALLAAVIEEERKIQLALELELAQADLNLNESIERLAVTAKAVEQATESAELTRSRYQQGLLLATQLIDAEAALLTARVRRAEAEADAQIARAAWRKVRGWSQLADTPQD